MDHHRVSCGFSGPHTTTAPLHTALPPRLWRAVCHRPDRPRGLCREGHTALPVEQGIPLLRPWCGLGATPPFTQVPPSSAHCTVRGDAQNRDAARSVSPASQTPPKQVVFPSQAAFSDVSSSPESWGGGWGAWCMLCHARGQRPAAELPHFSDSPSCTEPAEICPGPSGSKDTAASPWGIRSKSFLTILSSFRGFSGPNALGSASPSSPAGQSSF